MRTFFGVFVLSVVLLIAGCNGSDEALRDIRSKPNSFTGNKNPANHFNPGSTGDSDNANGLKSNEIRVTMEVPGGVAPGAEITRRNLRMVQPDNVKVYFTNPALQELKEPEGVSTRTDSNGSTVIAFENGRPLGPNVIVQARYGSTILRSFAADSDQNVKVNPFSEYLVQNTLSGYSPEQFQAIMACVDDIDGGLCLHKLVWSTLADQVHDFEINIPANYNTHDAIALLENRADFASFVAKMAEFALVNENSVGEISASSAQYNSIFMGIELGQTFFEASQQGSGQWGVRTGREKTTEDSYGAAHNYPVLSVSSLREILDINTTTVASDVPYERDVLIHQAGHRFVRKGPGQWALNTHSSPTIPATQVDATRLLAGRALLQSITGGGSSQTVGWTRNPFFMNAYTGAVESANSGPDRILSGYFSAGKAIKLNTAGNERKRGRTLEKHYVSAIDIDLLQKAGFKLSKINKPYNALYFSVLFNDDPSLGAPLVIESGIGDWHAGTGAVSQAYTTLERMADGSVKINDTGTRSASWVPALRQSRELEEDVQNGRLSLDITTPSGPTQKPDLGMGASTPDGSLLAFNLNDSPMGDGLFIAAEQTSVAAPVSGRYRLQGLAMGLGADSNHLKHFDNGQLTIVSGGSALLSTPTFNIVHSVSGESVSTPRLQAGTGVSLNYTASTNGRVAFKASAPGNNLVLKGFFTANKDQFFLRLRDTRNNEEFLGLVLATRIPE